MPLIDEKLPDRWTWWRLADPGWRDPLDPGFAFQRGGRWNPAGSFPTLYFNEDVSTARANLKQFVSRWPYEPEDLRGDAAPILVGATLPLNQQVCDAHTNKGLKAAGLPTTYPRQADGQTVGWADCQAVGVRAQSEGLRGVRPRSAQSDSLEHRELAWFPATRRSIAKKKATLAFDEWFWA